VEAVEEEEDDNNDNYHYPCVCFLRVSIKFDLVYAMKTYGGG
jgi:hypothetical protein